MKRISSISGFTLMELLISVGLLSTAGLLMSTLLSKPTHIVSAISAADQERLVNNAMGVLVNDLVQADPSLILWYLICPAPQGQPASITVTQSAFDSSGPNTSLNKTITYSFQANGSGNLGSLIRTVTVGTNAPVSTTLITNIIQPTLLQPLVQANTDPNANNVLIVTVQYLSSDNTPITIVRRVGIQALNNAP